MANKLILRNSAETWENASPVGSGRLGMMVYGGTGTDRLSFNEETLRAEDMSNTDLPGFRDKTDEAGRLFCESAGELLIRNLSDEPPYSYRRSLDLDEGTLRVMYYCGPSNYVTESFVSHPDSIAVHRISSNFEFGFEIKYTHPSYDTLEYLGSTVRVTATAQSGNRHFAFISKIKTDGTLTTNADSIVITKAKMIEIYTAIRTDFHGGDPVALAAGDLLATERIYPEILMRHINGFKALTSRSSVNFKVKGKYMFNASANDRLERLKNDPEATDPELVELYFAFGKYLLISSSHRDTLPANPQDALSDVLEAMRSSDLQSIADICACTEVGDGEGAGRQLRRLFTESTYENLFYRHPPFRLDGNLGGAAAIAEMLIGSRGGFISLLPALPAELDTGSFTGLRARGGYTVDAKWTEALVTEITVTPDSDGEYKLKLPDAQAGAEFVCSSGETVAADGSMLTLLGKAGITATLKIKK